MNVEQAERVWVKQLDGRFCERHWSWFCGVGEGECQREFIAAFIAFAQPGATGEGS